ncbi:MAG: shikimate dehydrogenase [Prochlorococcus sp.]|nr:shikimate dehydrogenase [Prochlorococcaceae cyanobacterium Fu_MAG_50]
MISGTTALVGVLGQPVRHSLSPVIHNAALAAMNLDWCYLAMPCETHQLRTVLAGLRSIDCRGLNITIPHKQDVAELCIERSQIAQRVGAVNTLIPHADDTWKGTNTDVAGFLAPLQSRGSNWQGRNALVLGCGGSARAVVAGLQDLNLAQITVLGRRAEALKAFLEDLSPGSMRANASSPKDPETQLQGALAQESDLGLLISKADLVVNTTPVGMSRAEADPGSGSDLPLGQEVWRSLQPATTLYDLIYTPRPTPWLRWGMEQGCQGIDGLEMLVQQAAAALKLWSGRSDIPVDLMRAAAESWLAH